MTAYENTVSLKRGEDSEKPEELERRHEEKRTGGTKKDLRRDMMSIKMNKRRKKKLMRTEENAEKERKVEGYIA